MTTSGSVDFSVSRDNLIDDALRLVGAIGPDDNSSTNQKTHSARILNMIAKGWQSYGCSLWARKTGYVFPQSDVNAINLGPSGGHASTSYTHTTTSAASASGASTITVTSATGILTTYNIGIEQSDGTMQWTTVNGTPAGSVVTLTATLTGAVSSGAHVYVYQTKIQRPLRVTQAFLHDLVDTTDVETWVISKGEYDLLSNKEIEGEPNQLAYDPQLDNGTLYITPRFKDGRNLITIVFQRPFEDFDTNTDTPDFPQEWYLPLMYALGVVLAPTYGMPVMDRAHLGKEAQMALSLALANEPEEGSLLIRPDDERA